MTWTEIAKKLNPCHARAIEAMAEAYRDPDVLVRVTFTDVEQVQETVGVLINLMMDHGTFKEFVPGRTGELPRVEINNGSAIEFAIKLAKKPVTA